MYIQFTKQLYINYIVTIVTNCQIILDVKPTDSTFPNGVLLVRNSGLHYLADTKSSLF